MKTIYLPATHKYITVSQYVSAYYKVRKYPEAIFPHGLNSWYSKTGKEIQKEYTDAIHERINERVKGKYLPINN
jgi:hypothetical protein